MKIIRIFLIIAAVCLISQVDISAQKKQDGAAAITAKDIESHMSFLASPLLKGRDDGDPGLEIAQQYIVSQVKIMGLKPANGTSYYQPYNIYKTVMDPEKTMIQIIDNNKDTVTINKPILQINPDIPADFDVSGEIIFAGYGLKQNRYKYNDFENIQTEGKILLIMYGAPTSEDGKRYIFEGQDWNSVLYNLNAKVLAVMGSRSKAVIIVMNPKSGFSSFDQKYPGYAGDLSSSSSLSKEQIRNPLMAILPKIILADRSVADEILSGSGHSLEELQKKIDTELKPVTFQVPGKQVRIKEASVQKEITLNNVAALIEGSDPVLKNEYLIFSGHADHKGFRGNLINAGADDNASGCAALLSIAKAFQSLDKKPLRSILFLWFSGEEIGLFGSKTYINNPLVPLEKTVADLNMDMIGRNKGVADTTSETPMTGPDKVFVITCNQSRELVDIANEIDKTTVLDLDYSLSGKNNPLQLFSRSDHYNFVQKDIPVLFFTSGLHSDYHTPGDVLEKIDFNKIELVSRAMYQIGSSVANRKTRIVVDNPFSKW